MINGKRLRIAIAKIEERIAIKIIGGKRPLIVITIVWVITTAVTAIYLMLSNPEMTDTQLLLNFWPLYLIGIGGGFLLLWACGVFE